jgi:hypothetical protein
MGWKVEVKYEEPARHANIKERRMSAGSECTARRKASLVLSAGRRNPLPHHWISCALASRGGLTFFFFFFFFLQHLFNALLI